MTTLDIVFNNIEIYFINVLLLYILIYIYSKTFNNNYIFTISIINNTQIFAFASIICLYLTTDKSIDVENLFIFFNVEVVCFYIFYKTSKLIIYTIGNDYNVLDKKTIVSLLLLKLVILLVNYYFSNGQYGIFSNGSRIDYFQISPLLSKILYVDILIDFMVDISIFKKIITRKSIRISDLIILLTVISIGFTSGSKGSSLLIIIYSSLYVILGFPKLLNIKYKRFMIISFIIIIFSYIYFSSIVNDVSFLRQFEIALHRFFLGSDARIMAFDEDINRYILSMNHGELLSELFRGPARLFGLFNADYPIGIYQYRFLFNTEEYVGSTTQLSAIFLIYKNSYWLLIEFLLFFIFYCVFIFLQTIINLSRSFFVKALCCASLYWLSTMFINGFDAYVQLLPIVIIFVTFSYFYFRYKVR